MTFIQIRRQFLFIFGPLVLVVGVFIFARRGEAEQAGDRTVAVRIERLISEVDQMLEEQNKFRLQQEEILNDVRNLKIVVNKNR